MSSSDNTLPRVALSEGKGRSESLFSSYLHFLLHFTLSFHHLLTILPSSLTSCGSLLAY